MQVVFTQQKIQPHSKTTGSQSLEGNYTGHHHFKGQQYVQLYNYYQHSPTNLSHCGMSRLLILVNKLGYTPRAIPSPTEIRYTLSPW